MGLQSELEHIAYDSIAILLLSIAAAAVRNLRDAVFILLHKIPLSEIDELVGSGIASLIAIAEQLNVNIACCSNSNGSDDCVVCLCEMRKGERLRTLECRHVFHKKCLNGWLKQLHFTCPLCRSPVPLPPSHSVFGSGMETSYDLVSWFGFR